MNRFMSTLQKDVMIQSRNNMYAISVMVAIVFAVIFTMVLKPEYLSTVIPAALLFIVGGTTIIFVGALIMEEKELGLIDVFEITPLNMKTYLMSKVVSLTFLSTLEVLIMIGIPIYWNNNNYDIELPNIAVLIVAVILLNLFYTLLGIGIVVRFNKLTDFMMPTVLIMIFLQVPIVYYSRIINAKLLLIIPSAAPIMLVQGAFNGLDLWQWIYGTVYTLLIVTVTGYWAYKAFVNNVLKKAR